MERTTKVIDASGAHVRRIALMRGPNLVERQQLIVVINYACVRTIGREAIAIAILISVRTNLAITIPQGFTLLEPNTMEHAIAEEPMG